MAMSVIQRSQNISNNSSIQSHRKNFKTYFHHTGKNDPRVPYTESAQIKDKINGNGGTVWFLMAKDEGRGFRKKNNVDFQFYSTIEFANNIFLTPQL
jgi:hypothetical protein